MSDARSMLMMYSYIAAKEKEEETKEDTKPTKDTKVIRKVKKEKKDDKGTERPGCAEPKE